MERQELLKLLKENKVDFTLLVKKEPDILQSLIDIEKSEPSSIKFTAEKTVRNLSENNPELFVGMEDKIFSLLKSENTFIRLGNIITCSNVAAGKVIDVFVKISNNSLYREEMLDFAKRNLNNTRNSTKRKAEKLVKKLEG